MGLLGNRFRSRVGVISLVAAGAAVLLAPPPALAEPTGADVQFRVVGNKVVELASKPFFVQLYNDGPESAENIVVKVDLGGLDTTKLGVEPPVGCGDPDGTIYTCNVGNLVPGEFNNLFSPFSVTSLEEGVPGPAGSFTVEVSADTADPNAENNKKVTVPVEVAPVAYDLIAIVQDVWDGTIGQRVEPGATVPFVFDFVNVGTRTAEHLVWKVTLPAFVTFAKEEQHDGCTYNDKRTEATCELPDAQLHPGGALSVLIGDPMLVTVAKDAPGPGALVGGIVAGGARRTEAPVTALAAAQATASNAKDVKVADATQAQKQKAAAAANDENAGGNDADTSDNDGAFSVHTAANPADLEAIGGSGSGALGDTVTITVKAKNHGPASSPYTTLTVTAPTGTELVDVPTGCEFTAPGKAAKCEFLLPAGHQAVGDFSFKIASSTIASNGTAAVVGTLEDPKPENNTAAIVITIGSGGGGGLPITGAKVSVISGTGAAVLVAGVALFLFARRRRVQLVIPTEDR
jgi:hypothetical protein